MAQAHDFDSDVTAMDDDLLGYLLGGLEAEEKQAVEERLRADPALRDRLAKLKGTLAPLALDAEPQPPAPALALATLARVAELHCRRPTPAPLPPVWRGEAPAARRRWLFRRPDVLVAAGLLILVGALAVPWLVRQWHEYQIRACQRNLAMFWNGLESYEWARGSYPRLEAEGPRSFAGMFVPLLHDAEALSPKVSILCPAAGQRTPDPRSVRDLEGLWGDGRREEFLAAVRDVGGSYAYPLGYQEGRQLMGLNRRDNDGQPILADQPDVADGSANSPNHGGRGQNVLFVGGEVRFCTTRKVGYDGDDIYLNKDNKVGAGLNRFDTVLGAGDARPFPAGDKVTR